MIKQVLKYTSLSVIGMLSISVYILVDTLFVSNVIGPLGLASLNLAIVVFSLITGIGLMIGIGGATLFIQKKDNKFFTLSLILGILFGLVFLVIGVFFPDLVVSLLQADNETYQFTYEYVRTIMIFTPVFMTNNVLISFVRHDKNPRLAMMAMVVSSAANIFLDYLFMVPLGMGMFGASFATSLSSLFSIGLLLTHFYKNKTRTLSLVQVKIVVKDFLMILKNGIASFVNEFSQSITLFLFNIVILSIHGNLGLSAYGIIANISLIVFAVMTGIGQGLQPIIGRYYRKNDHVNLYKTIRAGLWMAFGFGLITYLSLSLSSESVIRLFVSDDVVIGLSKNALRIYFIGFLFASVNVIVGLSLNVLNDAKKAFLISILRGFLLSIPFLLIFSKFFGFEGVFLSFVITELVVSVISLVAIKLKERQITQQY